MRFWFPAMVLVLLLNSGGILLCPEAGLSDFKRPDRSYYNRGRYVYQKNCVMCHGRFGRGDGPVSMQLVDEEQRPIRPADLRRSTRAGPDAEDVFRTLSTGISGTPMPSFLEALDTRRRWLITRYVMGLRKTEIH